MFALFLEPDFPLNDVCLLAADLEKANNLVPGFVPPDVGLLDVTAMCYAAKVDALDTFILPDRNIVTRIAAITRNGMLGKVDGPTALSAKVMAYAQCLHLQFEPSIAYHELAHVEGNEVAIEELKWFRKGDAPQPQAWVDLALGRRARIETVEVHVDVKHDLAYPLHRWRRNYLVALKIAELALSDTSSKKRMLDLLDWMQDDFLVAGPAAVFAAMYFAPMSPKRKMLKQLKSSDRRKAILGIKNAAWDITHLSEFVKLVSESSGQNRRYILATADKAMGILAPLLFWNVDEEDLVEALVTKLQSWWPQKEAQIVAESMVSILRVASVGVNRKRPYFDNESLEAWTKRLENEVFSWRPS